MKPNEPMYNIGVVARMTEIPTATLRIWERRYGFPEPSRTPGGHRLYTEREIEALRWVKDQIDAGMQTRQAIKAAESLRRSGEPLEAASDVLPPVPSPGEGDGRDLLASLREHLFDALLDHDVAQAERIFNQALGLYAYESVIVDLIGPTLAALGEGWERGEVGVATEHLATHYLRQWLLLAMRSGPPAYDVQPTILACAPGEWHEGSLLMFGALLRRRRWPVMYLGQSLPLADLAALAQESDPLAVVLVAMRAETAEALAAWPQSLPQAAQRGKPVVAYGGRIFVQEPDWQARVPGLFLGDTLQEGVEKLERVLQKQN